MIYIYIYIMYILYIGGWGCGIGFSPTPEPGNRFRLRLRLRCVRACEAACAGCLRCGWVWPGGKTRASAVPPGLCRRRKTTPLFYVG